jgi:hypothetical protein
MEPTELFRQKRKWQLALRRYVIEGKPCPDYARYFGLPVYLFREWIEMQFDKQTNWENFGGLWQFDHIIPVAYFDFENEHDLLLCWNFCNVRVEKLTSNRNRGNRVDVLACKAYFESIYHKTGYFICKEMLEKIESIEVSQIASNDELEAFISKHHKTLLDLKEFTQGDFERVNWGVSVADVIAENKLLAKYGK